MDAEKKRNLISSMLLYCLAGDLPVRINYVGILISRVENHLIEKTASGAEKSETDQVIAAIDNIVKYALILASNNTLDQSSLSEIRKIIETSVLSIDPSNLQNLKIAEDISAIKVARFYYYSSIDAYSRSGKSQDALADSLKNMDAALQNLVDVCDKNDLAEFGGNEWRENIVTRPEGSET